MKDIILNWEVYEVTIFGYGTFFSYEDLFDFLLSHKNEVFIFTTNTCRPIQREVQSLLIHNMNVRFKNMDDKERCYFNIVECWDEVTLQKFNLNWWEEILWITTGHFSWRPVNFTFYTT